MAQKTKKDILIYGAWPDPRSSGISSVVHDTITAANKDGRTVYLMTEGFDSKERLGPLSVKLMKIPGNKPFDWRETVKHIQEFHSIDELVTKDAAGKLNGRKKPLLSNVGLIHNHSDDMIPHYEPDKRNSNNYNTLISHIEALSGNKPALIRTRHDDAYQIGIDRLSRLTGIDWAALPDQEKLKYLANGAPLKEIVESYVAKNRDELKRKYDLDDDYLNNAIHHVWWVMHRLRLWRQEAKDCDAIVCLTEQDIAANKELIMPDIKTDNFTVVNNGSSFAPQNMDKINGLLHDFHSNQKLECYRGGKKSKEGISFAQSDKKIVFVGRACRGKGIYELAASLSNLYKKGHTNIRGIFVGDFDQDIRQRLAAVDPENSDKYLLFTGRVTDPDYLAAIFAFGNATAIPSYYESFNLTGVESLRMGKPLVVTNFSGPGEVYIKNPEKHGTKIALPVAKPFFTGVDRHYGVDEKSLTAQIEALITDDKLAYQLGQDGKKFVDQYYTHIRMGENYAKLYSKLLEDS